MKGETIFKTLPSTLPVKQEYDVDLQPDILTKTSTSEDIKSDDSTFTNSEDMKPDVSTVSFFDNQDDLKDMTINSLSSSAVIEKLSVLVYNDLKELKSICIKSIGLLSSNDQLIHENGKIYKCDMCNQRLVSLDHITQHIKLHTGETQTESNLSLHSKCHFQEGHYECDVSHKMFVMKTNLIKHTKVHPELKQNKCDLCNTKINFTDKTHKCCDYPEMYSKLSKQKTIIKMHNLTENKNVHSGYKKHECCICHKMFARKFDLNMHMELHRGEKNHQCDTHLTRHRKIHSVKKKYECDICHKKFIQSDHLSKQNKTHSSHKPDKCNVCRRKFVRRDR
ncbi:zinc finger protein 540-like [Physella acuta]|uniref:zinc finger protein 540-like n=1 Tax=Physella acuta TaxID=109671 RepID=UPI0027DC44F7|nr:zinc finger protein 540-like [Physella acuta]